MADEFKDRYGCDAGGLEDVGCYDGGKVRVGGLEGFQGLEDGGRDVVKG